MPRSHGVNKGASEIETLIPDEDEAFCHVQSWPGSLTLCGMRSSGPEVPLHDGEYVEGVCTGCGKPSCKTCEIMEGWA